MSQCQRYQNAVKNSYIIEFIHKNYFSSYLDKLEKSIEALNKVPKHIFQKNTE